jgi:hypothetical protein
MTPTTPQEEAAESVPLKQIFMRLIADILGYLVLALLSYASATQQEFVLAVPLLLLALGLRAIADPSLPFAKDKPHDKE